MKILLVEDEKALAEAVAVVLRKNNYSVDLAYDGEYGLDSALTGMYDIVILDRMLPKIDGITLLKRMRAEKIASPVLLLTALGETEDKVFGLDSGADDYLAKPFQTSELLARLRALGRRQPELQVDGVMIHGALSLNPHHCILSIGEREEKLTVKEAQLLELLIARKHQVVSKDVIIEKLWGYDTNAEDSLVETHMSLLRRKLKRLGMPNAILTIRGLGYSLSKED